MHQRSLVIPITVFWCGFPPPKTLPAKCFLRDTQVNQSKLKDNHLFSCIFSGNCYTSMHYFEYRGRVIFKTCYLATYTFSCASRGTHTCHRRTSAGGRPWPHNDGTRCASYSGAYRKMMFPSSERQEIRDQEQSPTDFTKVQCSRSLVSAQKNESQKSFVQTFVFEDIIDKTNTALKL